MQSPCEKPPITIRSAEDFVQEDWTAIRRPASVQENDGSGGDAAQDKADRELFVEKSASIPADGRVERNAARLRPSAMNQGAINATINISR